MTDAKSLTLALEGRWADIVTICETAARKGQLAPVLRVARAGEVSPGRDVEVPRADRVAAEDAEHVGEDDQAGKHHRHGEEARDHEEGHRVDPDGLERQKERLLARMEIIEQLQKSRPEIVHLFDEVTRRMPEGVYLTSMKQTGTEVEVKGVAQSSTRVSALMRQVDASEWLADPGVVRVETTEQGPARQAEFVVTMRQVSSSDEGMEDEG